MLFNSYIFIFVFLPATLVFVFVAHARLGKAGLFASLTIASLVFYAWWDPRYAVLPIGSMLVNYAIGRRVAPGQSARRAWLVLGLASNLGLLCWFKYAAFFATNVEALTGFELSIQRTVLPLAISFITFEQIAYLVDRYRGQIGPHGFLLYSAFLTYFPHLIAGPIVRFEEIADQLTVQAPAAQRWDDAAAGTAIFVIGLFKKVVIADNLAPHADSIFALAESGAPITLFAAWAGALAYTFQLYFDFSGYSEMALGLSLLFGVRLPINFLSPYKARSIIEFWRRWHVSLSRFLRDYLYIPLGGNRRGTTRRYGNLMLTMTLAGLWHGAGWTFVIWGAIHGAMLVVNHGWRALAGRLGRAASHGTVRGGILTFLCVVLAWVVFRAETVGGASHLLAAMAGKHGIVLPTTPAAIAPWLAPLPTVVLPALAVSAVIVFLLPNVPQLFAEHLKLPREAADALRPRLVWRFDLLHGAMLGLLAFWSLASLARPQQFLYFNF